MPDLVPRPDVAEKHLPAPAENGSRTTEMMPGFEDQPVQFYAGEKTAEDIFRNGKRLRAAIEDELLYFKKSEGAKAGNLKKIRDVKIVVGWTVWCRTEGS